MTDNTYQRFQFFPNDVDTSKYFTPMEQPQQQPQQQVQERRCHDCGLLLNYDGSTPGSEAGPCVIDNKVFCQACCDKYVGDLNETVNASNVLDYVIRYETAETWGDMLTNEEQLALFQYLIDTGLVWQLQGSYGRTATDLISAGLCTFDPEKRGIVK